MKMRKKDWPDGWIPVEALPMGTKATGVYCMMSAGGVPLYVGISQNIRSRTLNHSLNADFAPEKAMCILTPKKDKLAERVAIRYLAPKHNACRWSRDTRVRVLQPGERLFSSADLDACYEWPEDKRWKWWQNFMRDGVAPRYGEDGLEFPTLAMSVTAGSPKPTTIRRIDINEVVRILSEDRNLEPDTRHMLSSMLPLGGVT